MIKPYEHADRRGWVAGWWKGAVTLGEFLMGQVLAGKQPRTRSVGTSTSAVGVNIQLHCGSSARIGCYLARGLGGENTAQCAQRYR